jgi:DNA invertase Pin-like site-specific DNA recombinase
LSLFPYGSKDPKQSLVKVYADKVVSGTSVVNRTEFLKLMEDAKAGKIDRIITKSISRFGRNTVDVIEHVRMLKNLSKPVEVVFQREGIRTLKENSEVMLTVYSSLAQEESRSLSESVVWGRRKLAERGAITDRYPRYRYDHEENGEMVINPEQAEIVQRM